MTPGKPGTIVILNGAPRAGKTSIARVIQDAFDGIWLNLGVDASISMTPAKLRPGIGLRPGGERPDLEPVVAILYEALYESAAAHSRLGVNVVMDLAHHERYATPMRPLISAAKVLCELPVVVVGVHCTIETILARRAESETHYVRADANDPLPEPVMRWQEAVHQPGIYDLEVDTSESSPEECAAQIRAWLDGPQPKTGAIERLAALAS